LSKDLRLGCALRFLLRAGENMARGSVKRIQTNKDDSGDPRQLGRSLNSDLADPEEGRRLVKALLAIKDVERRRALIEYAEAIAREKI
jgi:hypothetical protein